MRKCVLAFFLAVASIQVLAATELDGTWSFQLRADWAPPEVICSIRTTGDALAGTCSSRGRQVGITDGTVVNGRARWTLSAPSGPGGALVTYDFYGALDPQSDTVSGTLTARGLNGGGDAQETPFTAARRLD